MRNLYKTGGSDFNKYSQDKKRIIRLPANQNKEEFRKYRNYD